LDAPRLDLKEGRLLRLPARKTVAISRSSSGVILLCPLLN